METDTINLPATVPSPSVAPASSGSVDASRVNAPDTDEPIEPAPSSIIQQRVNNRLYESTLATVRELSENATLRPAPRKLFCLPLQAFRLKPIPKWKREMIMLRELAATAAYLARTRSPNNSALA